MDAAELVRGHVSDEQFAVAIGTVPSIGRTVLGETSRREAAVRALMQGLHVPEHVARLLVELGVSFMKTADANVTPGQ